jgi:DNA-binding protein HU-beta
MTHSDLVDAIAAGNDLTKANAKKIVDAVFATIGDAAAKGDEIAINNFGKFKVKATPAREGRNPATGQAMTIKASKKLTFTPAKAVKDRLNG